MDNKTAAPCDSSEAQFIITRLLQGGDEGYISLKKQSLREGLGPSTSKDRAIAWKTFLGFHTTPARKEQWLLEANVHRTRYQQLKDKHMNQFIDAEEDHPLSREKESPWFKHFQREQLHKTILQDVDRTYPEYEFFHQDDIKKLMMDILFVYACEYNELSYRQGMHELLAIVIYVIMQGVAKDHEKFESAEEWMRTLSTPKYVEHDSFACFEKIMRTTSDWFITKQSKIPQTESPIIVKCQRIYNEVLRTRDPELHAYLTFLAVEPQVYLLRWVRLVFSREFNLEETLVLWDGIFAYDKAHSLIDYVAVSMLISIKAQILAQDANGVLSLLFKYPSKSVEGGITGLLERARVLLKQRTLGESIEKKWTKWTGNILPGNKSDDFPIIPPLSSSGGAQSVSPPSRSDASSDKRKLPSRSPTLSVEKAPTPVTASPPTGFRTPVPTVNKPFNQVTIPEKVDATEAMHQNVAKHLRVIIEVLQPVLFNPANGAVPDDAYIALAQLKAIKDVLIGHLPAEALPQMS